MKMLLRPLLVLGLLAAAPAAATPMVTLQASASSDACHGT